MFDLSDWYQFSREDTFTGRRAQSHLHALSNTPYYPKSSRCKRRDKTRDYRRKSWRRQPIKQ